MGGDPYGDARCDSRSFRHERGRKVRFPLLNDASIPIQDKMQRSGVDMHLLPCLDITSKYGTVILANIHSGMENRSYLFLIPEEADIPRNKS